MSASHHPPATSGTAILVALTDDELAAMRPGDSAIVETPRGMAGFHVLDVRLGAAEDKHGKPYSVPVADGWIVGGTGVQLTYAAADLYRVEDQLERAESAEAA